MTLSVLDANLHLRAVRLTWQSTGTLCFWVMQLIGRCKWPSPKLISKWKSSDGEREGKGFSVSARTLLDANNQRI